MLRMALWPMPLILICLATELAAQPASKSAAKPTAAETAAPAAKVDQAWLGVSRWWANQREVVLLGVLSDGPAGKAGLKEGDSILAIAGKPIGSLDDLQQAMNGHHAGDQASFDIERKGQRETLAVKLELQPKDGGVSQFRKAAERGETWAMCELGFRYGFQDQESSFVKRDQAESARWFRRAIAKDSEQPIATLFLAILYTQGPDSIRDYAEAQRLLMKAREMKGEGVPKGIASAASNQLAMMCLSGQGLDKDKTLALQFYLDAADQGSLSAMHHLGVMFEQGIGVVKDDKAAERWFSKASSLGYKPSQHAMFWLTLNTEVASAAAEKKAANGNQEKPKPGAAQSPATGSPASKPAPKSK